MASTPSSVSHSPHFVLQAVGKTRSPRGFVCSHANVGSQKEESQNWNGVKVMRGKKLLKDLSTWGIGGPCNYFVHVLHQTPTCFCHQIEFLERKERGIYRVGSGFRFNSLGMQCSNEGFTGLEFAGGIPGTVGGATFMNAGANGQETAEVIDRVDIVTVEGKLQTLNRDDLKFGYRLSSFQYMKDLAAIVAVTFRLQESGSARRKQQEYMASRRMTQPLGERTAGSVFRNPDIDVAAAELIEKAGLKGLRVGGAMVSNIHANFFVNVGGSTSQDMLNLIAIVKEKIDHKFSVQLMEEVVYCQPHCNHLKLRPNRDRREVDEIFDANKINKVKEPHGSEILMYTFKRYSI